jgi:hypothetical protein
MPNYPIMDELPFIETLEAEIADLESLLVQKKTELAQLKAEPRTEAPMLSISAEDSSSPGINNLSTPEDKIILFHSLFRGREDIYAKPWQRKPDTLSAIMEPLPSVIEVIISDQIYINHTGLPPILRNRILRLASFSNIHHVPPDAHRIILATGKYLLGGINRLRLLSGYAIFLKYDMPNV